MYEIVAGLFALANSVDTLSGSLGSVRDFASLKWYAPAGTKLTKWGAVLRLYEP